MEELKRKLQVMHEILACSKKQADFLASREDPGMEGLGAVTEVKQNLIDALSEIEEKIKSAQKTGDAAEQKLTEEISQVLRQITELDAQNIKSLQDWMGEVRSELHDTKEKIKINKAYQPILGKEKNTSRRLDIKDNSV